MRKAEWKLWRLNGFCRKLLNGEGTTNKLLILYCRDKEYDWVSACCLDNVFHLSTPFVPPYSYYWDPKGNSKFCDLQSYFPFICVKHCTCTFGVIRTRLRSWLNKQVNANIKLAKTILCIISTILFTRVVKYVSY